MGFFLQESAIQITEVRCFSSVLVLKSLLYSFRFTLCSRSDICKRSGCYNLCLYMQVLDARDPQGTRCYHLERHLREHCKHKHMVLLLNKVSYYITLPQHSFSLQLALSVLYTSNLKLCSVIWSLLGQLKDGLGYFPRNIQL